MALIIDGHNLIGVLPGIELGEPEDELLLLDRLRSYRVRTGGTPLIVFFDSGDLPAATRDQSSPGLKVRYSDPGEPADDAIIEFLSNRGQPGQYAVVTNDQGLQYRARMAGASVIPANVFAARLAPPRSPAAPPIREGPDPHDPAFADIYAGFVEADRNAARFGSAAPEDVTFWAEQLYGEDLEAAQNAARWLGQFGGSQALDPLRDALTHNDARVRAAALLALGDLSDPAGLPALRQHLLHDAASLAREAAAQSLGRMGDRSSEEDLETAAANDGKNKVRKAARTALAQVRARRSADKDKRHREPS